ncbi:MAG: dimethylarginine dimethylaminohydrolase family protein [Candidatus Thorarchaeota archaeon]
MQYKTAITREPSASYLQCISDHPLRDTISVGKARRQHQYYRDVLTNLGIEVILIPQEENLPDACFVEDTVILYKGKAFITRMAKESRRGEETAIIQQLKKNFPLKIATEPATIEGGDVIHLENSLIVGATERTNQEGIAQMKSFLSVNIDIIADPKIMHLKSHVTYLGKNTMIVTKNYAEHPVLGKFKKIVVPPSEIYAANTLSVNGAVLMAKNYPKTQQLVRDAGFDVIPLDTSEFEKCGGALTCLSILF